MAREARKLSKSGNYYVELRGEMLFCSDEDKKKFVEILEKNFATGIIHGYKLDKERIRLVVKESEKGISQAMKSVTTSYARYFNRTNNRDGKLFLDRFKSEPLETEDEIFGKIASLDKDVVKKKRTVKRVTSQVQETEEKKKEVIETEEKKKPLQKKSLPSWLL